MTMMLFFIFAVTILWGSYKLLFCQLKYLKANRITLLVIPIIPFIIYILSGFIQMEATETENIVKITLAEVSVSVNQPIEVNGYTSLQLLIGIYLIGTLISLLFTAIGYFQVFKKLKQFKFNSTKQNIKIAYTDQSKSYSFFNYIHISKDLQNNPDVLDHEITHVLQGHSWDVLLYNIYRIIFWFHPVIYLLDNEIKLVHEYLADEKVGSTVGKNNYANNLLNIYFGTGSIQFINQFNNQKFIKMRLKMLSKNGKKSQLWRYAAVPTLLAVLSLSVSSFKTISADTNYETKATDPVYDSVDVMPEFKGGMSELFVFMGKNIQYPKQSANDGIQGKCMVEFIVTKTGEIKDAQVLKGINEEIDKESLRVINAMPKWTPGEKDGKKVNVKMVLPIAYKLDL